MSPEQTVLIDTYLNDQTKLYQDWYLSIQPPQANDPDTTPFGIQETLEELKQCFLAWWKQSVETDTQRLQDFKDRVCKKWLALKDHEKIHVLIAIVLDSLSYLHLPHSPPVATILVTSGYLNHLCAECE